VVVSEELLILASSLLRPMSRNSVFGEFSVRRFAVTQARVQTKRQIDDGDRVRNKHTDS